LADLGGSGGKHKFMTLLLASVGKTLIASRLPDDTIAFAARRGDGGKGLYSILCDAAGDVASTSALNCESDMLDRVDIVVEA
jgi:hypothetical protein